MSFPPLRFLPSAERIAGLVQPVVVALGTAGVVGGMLAALVVVAGRGLQLLGLGLAQR